MHFRYVSCVCLVKIKKITFIKLFIILTNHFIFRSIHKKILLTFKQLFIRFNTDHKYSNNNCFYYLAN